MNYYLEIEWDNRFFEVEIEIIYEKVNSGLGFYEYHGQKCFDRGTDYLEVTNYKILEINEFGPESEFIQKINKKTAPPELKNEIDRVFENEKEKIEEELNQECLAG